VLRKTRKYSEAGIAYHIFQQISRIILAEGDNFIASLTEAGLLQYFPCLLVPQHEIQVAHGDVNGFGKFLHLYFYGQVLPFGRGFGNGVYYSELFEVFQDVPVEDGQVLVEADVSQEMAGLLVPNALYIPYKPLPCLIAIIELTEYRSERDWVSVQELVAGLQIKKISGDNCALYPNYHR
jgi:hypothetical protein